MQPPSTELLHERINRLKAEASKPSAPAVARPLRGNPAHPDELVAHYAALLRAWLATVPPGQQHRRFTLQELAQLARLPGQRGSHPPAWGVGPAARAVGFECVRDWKRAGRNRRYWKLPC